MGEGAKKRLSIRFEGLMDRDALSDGEHRKGLIVRRGGHPSLGGQCQSPGLTHNSYGCPHLRLQFWFLFLVFTQCSGT